MLFGKTKMEMQVGMFVFIALVVCVVFVLYIGGVNSWKAGYNLTFIFDFVNGVKIGAPVRFAGVDVGQVNKTVLVMSPEEGKVKVHVLCRINGVARIPEDSEIWVNTLGLLGEKYIEIMPGKNYESIVPTGALVKGNDPVPMHEIAALAKNVVSDFSAIVSNIKNGQGTLGNLLYSDTLYKELETMIIDLRRHPWKLLWKTKE